VGDYGDQTLQALLLWAPFLLPAHRGSRASATATLAYLAQLFLIYVTASVHKVRAPAWLHGEILPAILLRHGASTPIGLALAGHPSLCAALSTSTLAFELLAPMLLFVPRRVGTIRLGLVAGFALMHLGFALCMRLGWFPLFSIVAWLPLVPTAVWDRFSAPLPKSDVAPLGVPGRALAVGLLVAVEGWTLAGVAHVPRGAVQPAFVATGLDQDWAMFNGVPEVDGVFTAPASVGGERVELMSLAGPSQRWTNYLAVQMRSSAPELYAPWIDWLCRTWKSQHGQTVGDAEIDFVRASPPATEVRIRGRCGIDAAADGH
jgi:hypothetical protein